MVYIVAGRGEEVGRIRGRGGGEERAPGGNPARWGKEDRMGENRWERG